LVGELTAYNLSNVDYIEKMSDELEKKEYEVLDSISEEDEDYVAKAKLGVTIDSINDQIEHLIKLRSEILSQAFTKENQIIPKKVKRPDKAYKKKVHSGKNKKKRRIHTKKPADKHDNDRDEDDHQPGSEEANPMMS
jgi:hypothetical protein